MEEKQSRPINDSLEQKEFINDSAEFFGMFNAPKDPHIQKLIKKEINNKITKEEQEELDNFLDTEDEKMRKEMKNKNPKQL